MNKEKKGNGEKGIRVNEGEKGGRKEKKRKG